MEDPAAVPLVVDTPRLIKAAGLSVEERRRTEMAIRQQVAASMQREVEERLAAVEASSAMIARQAATVDDSKWREAEAAWREREASLEQRLKQLEAAVAASDAEVQRLADANERAA